MTVSITDNTISQDGADAVKFNAGGVSSSAKQITASVAANALTAGLNPCVLDFRSATLTDGTTNTRLIDAAISLTVPDTATLGCVSAVQSRLILLAIDNAGTVELAIVNQSGGVNLDESDLISTTALSTGSDSADVIYSTTARSNVPYRVVGFIESTQATAGTWATSPSTLQGAGGNALTAMGSLGYGQTWQVVTGSRALSTTYYNTTGKPIEVSYTPVTTGTQTMVVNGVTIINQGNNSSWIAIVPAAASYSITSTVAIGAWRELR